MRIVKLNKYKKCILKQIICQGDVVGWTSWELYNFVLIGITNELIELGASSEIKMTTLQIWSAYLTELEVAFISTTKKCVPKMARRYQKK